MNITRKFENTQGKTPPTPPQTSAIESDLLLHTTGFHDDEVVGFINVDNGKAVYMAYSKVKAFITSCVENLENPENHGISVLSQPLNPGHTTCKWSNPCGLTYSKGDIARVLWVHLSVSKKNSSKSRLTGKHQSELLSIFDQVAQYTKEHGFNAVVGRWSGYAAHLSIPVELEHSNNVYGLLEQLSKTLQKQFRKECGTDYQIVASLDCAMGVVGVNDLSRKVPAFRKLLNRETLAHPTEDDVIRSRVSNTEILNDIWGEAGIESLPTPIDDNHDCTHDLLDTGDLANFELPPDIEKIAGDIGHWNHKYTKSCDRAAAIAIFSDMVGRTRKFNDNTFGSLNIVLVAESSSGKGAGSRYVNALAHQISSDDADYQYQEHIITTHGSQGSMTIEGLCDRVYEHGEILILGDESEELVLPDEKQGSASAKTREIRNKLAAASTNGPGFGRAKANGGSRIATSVTYVTEYHTTQPAPFYSLLAGNHADKGYLARIQIWRGGSGRRNHNVNETISADVLELANHWYQKKHTPSDRELPYYKGSFDGVNEVRCYGATFIPESKVITWGNLEGSFRKEAERLDSIVVKHSKNGEHLLANYVSKDVENLKRYALLFTLGYDRNALEIHPRAFEQAIALIQLKNKSFQNNLENYSESPKWKKAKLLHNKIWHLSKGGTERIRRNQLMDNLPNSLRTQRDKVDDWLWLLHNNDKIQYVRDPKPATIVAIEKPESD